MGILTIILGAVIALLVALYFYFTWYFDFWTKRGVAGPVPKPYLGTYPKTAKFEKGYNLLTEANEIYQKYWRTHRFVGTFEYNVPVLLILDPALVKEIYTTHFRNFPYNAIGDSVDRAKNPVFGGNPFVHKGDEWKKLRSEVAVGLTQLKVKAMFPIVEKIGERLVKFVDAELESGKNHFDAKRLAERFTAEAVCNCVYGLEANTFGEHSEFLTEARKSFARPTWMAIHGLLIRIFPFLTKIYPLKWLPQESNDWFIHLMEHAVKARKQSGQRRDDYLNSLLEVQAKKGLPTFDLAVHGYTFFMDGFETSSHFLSHMLVCLAEYPEFQRKLRAEIVSYAKIEFDDLCKMPYLDMVFSEGIRHAPFPFPLWKMCTEGIELTDTDGTTLKLEKGTTILFPTQSLDNHPELYTKPLDFNPDRFEGSDGRDLKYYTDIGVYVAFGNGPRICPGRRFATMQIKVALCALVKNFEILKTTEPTEVDPGFFFPVSSFKIALRRIQHN